MDRGYAAYSRQRPPRPLGWSPFRTAHLNVVGWSALGGSCLAAGAAGWWIGARAEARSGWGLLAAGLPVVAVVALDRRRWYRMETGIDWGGSVAEVEQVAAEINARGGSVHVVHHQWHADSGTSVGLRVVGRDRRLVERVLRERGIPSPWRRPR